MFSGIMEALCQISVFMICVQTIIHFRPKASYEKYLKMLVSIMLLMQIFLAVEVFFSGNKKEGLTASVQKFTAELNEGMHRASENAFYLYEDVEFEITGERPYTEDIGEKEKLTEDIAVQIEGITRITVDNISGAEQ